MYDFCRISTDLSVGQRRERTGEKQWKRQPCSVSSRERCVGACGGSLCGGGQSTGKRQQKRPVSANSARARM